MNGRKFLVSNNLGILFIVVIAALFLGACQRSTGQGVRFASTSDPGVNNAQINNGASCALTAPPVSFADIVSRVSPAVITIHSEMRVRAPQQYPFMDDPMFRQFFGDRVPQQIPEQRRSGLGSGVIISTD